MFRVYQPQGISFTGPLEQLLERHPHPRRNPLQPPQWRTVDRFKITGNAQLNTYRQISRQPGSGSYLPATELMRSPVATIPYSAGIRQAWQEMAQRNVAQLPVLADDLRPIGMLTWASLLKFVVFSGDQVRFVKGVAVKDIMLPELIAAEETTDVRRMVSMMVAYNVNAVPVAGSRDRLVGIISRSDILNLMAGNPALNLHV